MVTSSAFTTKRQKGINQIQSENKNEVKNKTIKDPKGEAITR